MSESPLGDVELTSVVTFGVREAALAGVAVSPAATAGRGGLLFADTSTLVWTMHPTCSGGTLTFTYESYLDRLEYDPE